MDGHMDIQMDGHMNGQTDRRTDPPIEMGGRIKKKFRICQEGP